jgi:cation transport ATPase
MTGLLNPLVAATLMPLSSLTVIVSSYRARTFARPGTRPVREAVRP